MADQITISFGVFLLLLAFDPLVIEAVQRHAQSQDMPLKVVQRKMMPYGRETVPSFNADRAIRIGYWVAKKIARLLYRVRVGLIREAHYTCIEPQSTVVFVMNHRANMDNIRVAALVHRRSGNPLYRRVLERYIPMATREGVGRAVLLEGGLSRDGRLRNPKLGLVEYMLRGV
ncbi:MAG: hypothetical protein PVJ53_12240 [Desulfobacterales bacterium]|jgi:glycerol-3-phosphate O-acyltransferase